jgi:hypothetical protein
MTAVGFGLMVQRLPRARDRVLTLARVVGSREGDGRFTPGEIAGVFDALRLPSPGNVSQELSRLRDEGLVMRRRSSASWSLTPEGDVAVESLVGKVDSAAVEAEQVATGSAQLAGGEYPLLPPEMAPARFLPAVRRVCEVAPFARSVFCMTRFPAEGHADDPVVGAIEALRTALDRHGLVLRLASDRRAGDEVLENVAAHMWGCKYGIALLETRDPRPDANRELNDNVLIEVGAMLATGRRCALLKDIQAPRLPTDFVAQIYTTLDVSDPDAVAAAADSWVVEDLGFRPAPGDRGLSTSY